MEGCKLCLKYWISTFANLCICGIVAAHHPKIDSWAQTEKNTDVAPKDLLFIALYVLNTATSWDLMYKIFEKKNLHFRGFFSCAVNILSLIIYSKVFVINYYAKLSMTSLVKKQAYFKKSLFCLCHGCDFPTGKSSLCSDAWGKTILWFQIHVVWLQNWSVCCPKGPSNWHHTPSSISDLVIFQETWCIVFIYFFTDTPSASST